MSYDGRNGIHACGGAIGMERAGALGGNGISWLEDFGHGKRGCL